MEFIHYFTDPLFRGPVIGTMLMALSSSLVSVLVFFQRRSLVGEVLSHTSYPGIILGIALSTVLFSENEAFVGLWALIIAFISSLIGLALIDLVMKKGKIHEDTALCFVLSSFFGVGVLLASIIQQNHPLLYRAAQSYLFGQAATMNDLHIFFYAIFALIVIAICIVGYRHFQTMLFDPNFAKSIGFQKRGMTWLYHCLLALSVVIGIRSVGVVLMSAMLIAPAATASKITKKLSHCFIVAAHVGVLGAFGGVLLSLKIPSWFPIGSTTPPTGPFIVLILSLLCLIVLMASFRRKKQALKKVGAHIL